MGIGYLVAGARRHQQLVPAIGLPAKWDPLLLFEVGESALETARHVRIRALPRPESGERLHPRQLVSIRELLEDDAGQRRCRFADGKARMLTALEQAHAAPEA